MDQINGCCSGNEGTEPARIENRPGLKALDYRIGTHASFLAAMEDRLSSLVLEIPGDNGNVGISPLQSLTTRELDDFSISLLDSWALVGDVLTFYEERIANECYLRTAVELRSIWELAKLIGYNLKPGVSSSVDLAFNLEKGYNAEIPEGTRVQSLPAPGEAAQTFETSEPIKARAEWNQIRPRLSQPQSITYEIVSGSTEFVVYFMGTDLNLSPNQLMMFVFDGESKQVLMLVKSVEPQVLDKRTKVTLQKWDKSHYDNQTSTMNAISRSLFLTRLSSRWAYRALSMMNGTMMPLPIEVIKNMKLSWPVVANQMERKPVDTIRDGISNILIKVSTDNYLDGMKCSKILADPSEMGVYVFRLTTSLFGHNAPAQKPSYINGGSVPTFDDQKVVIDTQSGATPTETSKFIYLDGSYDKIVPQSWVVAQGQDKTFIRRAEKVTPSISRSEYGITGKTTLIELDKLEWSDLLPGPDDKDRFNQLRKTLVYAQSEDLTSKLAEVPIVSDIKEKIIELDGYYDGLQAGKQLIVYGQTTDDLEISGLSDAERVSIAEIFHGLKTGDYGSPSPELDLALDSIDLKYKLLITNSNQYSEDIFKSSPNLPDTSTGMWADIYSIEPDDPSNPKKLTLSSIKLNSTDDLNNLKIDLGSNGTNYIYLELHDRNNNVRYISNLVPIQLDPGKKLLKPSIQVIVIDRESNKTKVHYILSVRNWFVYPIDDYKVEIFDDTSPNSINQTQYKQEDLNEISFDLDINGTTPNYFYIKMTGANADQFYISNLVYNEIKTFLPGDTPHTTLVLAKDLDHYYKRDSVAIYANLAHATHGETRSEVLGSGDGSQALQEFPLRQFPLTYLPAPTPQGAESTLKVRVNDILWHESESLTDMGPSDRKFITKRDDQSKTRVIFGNGVKGLRPTTGVENIKAVYRTGIGKVGNVRAGRISLLMTRPLGVKGVINPILAKGGIDPEGVDQARRNAPLAVMALDRLVSVRDYEDFARSYAGIGKASAVRLSDGRRVIVHVSIAGIDDVPIDQDSDLYKNLFQALHRYGDAYQPLRIDICERKLLFIKANVRLDPDYLWSSVEPKIRSALLEALSFEIREPGQDVVRSEVIMVIQQVPGVVYVDVDIMDSISETEASDPVNEAKRIASLLDNMAGSGGEDDTRRISADLARPDEDDKDKILPAQIAYLSPEIPEAIVLKELI